MTTVQCTSSKILWVVDPLLFYLTKKKKKEARKGGVECTEDTSTFWHGNILAHCSPGVTTLMTTY